MATLVTTSLKNDFGSLREFCRSFELFYLLKVGKLSGPWRERIGFELRYSCRSRSQENNVFKQIFNWKSNLSPFLVNSWVAKKTNSTKDLIHLVDDPLFRFAPCNFVFSTVSASLVWSFEWRLLFLCAFVFSRKTLLFPFREKPFLTLIVSKSNPLNSDTSFLRTLRTLSMAPSVY